MYVVSVEINLLAGYIIYQTNFQASKMVDVWGVNIVYAAVAEFFGEIGKICIPHLLSSHWYSEAE